MHPVLSVLLRAARNEFPPVDGGITVLPPLHRGLEAVLAFTGHSLVATARSPEAVLAQGPDGYGSSLAPDFLRWLAGPTGSIGVIDATLVAFGTGGGTLPRRLDADDHPRVCHAREIREDVVVHGDDRGLITLGHGIGGRREMSVEVDRRAGPGHGRPLIEAALALTPSGEPLFAAVAPGNARSLRAFLAAGFVPIGSEVIIQPDPARGSSRPARPDVL